MSPQPLAVDLCCGLGGWTEGLLAEGWDVVGFDVERHQYGDQRYPAQLVLQDILTLDGRQFRGKVSLIVASPPCQKYSYMAMPWTRAKALAVWYRDPAFPERLVELNALFNACVRIGREAECPIVIENVKGIQPWVGKAKAHYGSYYLFGDVPALMPIAHRAHKVPGFRFDGNGGSFQTASVGGTKNAGGSWFNIGSPGQPPGFTGDAWFDESGKSSSKSSARKAASARIAKIPAALASHIAHVYKPRESQVGVA